VRAAPLHFLAVGFLWVACPAASAQVVYVDDTAVGANDGTSWQDAFTDLQPALALAGPSGVVWVARGTYRPSQTLDRFARFTVRGAVFGGFDGTETTFADRAGLFDETILTGDLLGNDGPGFTGYGDNSENVVYFGPVDIPVLDGFTVRGGNSSARGGGLLIEYFSFGATVRHCTFVANHAAGQGGGIDCAFSEADTFIDRCTFLGNRTRGDGGGVSGSLSTYLRSCRFLGNSAEGQGGGLEFAWTAVDCLFSGNTAAGRGGGASYTDTVVNCTFSGNRAALGGGMSGAWPWAPSEIRNSVFWGNADDAGTGQSGQVAGAAVVDESVVQAWDGSLAGTGTFDADPLFRSPLGADGTAGTLDDDLRLESGSPCIDTAPLLGYVGILVDALGRPRLVDSLLCDGGGKLDRGALERGEIDGTTVYCESTSSSTGAPAEIGGPCRADPAGGALAIVAQPVPAGRAFLLLGNPGAPHPFGDGNLCLAGALRRTAPVAPSGGSVVFHLDPNSPPGSDVLLPGATVGLQVLFRDTAAGGTGFNLSSAMRLLALP
jgi:hypothetical protein